MNFGTLVPGTTVVAKVKPDDRSKVCIDLSQPVASPGATLDPAGVGRLKSGGSARELLMSGEAGVTPEPGTEDDPIYLFEVEVSLDGGAPNPARFGHRVPKDRIASQAPGSNVRVAVDPSRPSEAADIDFSAA